ncbi:MAG: PAS domain S-box protein, partial [Leptospiraceae bacterium]|nr:PAS domain S-box protein [Leptospiraceae bacterium]
SYPWITAAFGLILLAVSYYVQVVFRDKSVRFFTLSLFVLAITSLVHNLTNFGFLPYKFVFSRALYFGVGIASIFVALSINERLFFKQQKLFSRRRKLDNIVYRKRLRQSVEDFEELIRVIPVGIYRYSKLKDGTLKFKYVSPKWCEINGISAEAVLQDPSIAIEPILHPEDLPSFLETNLKAILNEERFLWEGRIIVAGKVKFVHIESYPVKKPDGKIDWIGIEYDITEKNLQDRDLQIFAKLADNTSDAVVITNSEGQILWINHAFTELTGYTLQEALGKTPGSLLHGPETSLETRARLSFAIHNFQPIREIILNYNKAGKPYWADLTINPIFDEKGKCCNFIGIQKNVTEQVEETLHLKKEFQELEQEKKKVLRYVHQKSEFLAAMSHEIRTPLTAIVGFTDLLSDTLKDESQKYFLQSIQIAVKNLMEVVNNILDYSKIEAGKVKLEFFETDVNEMFDYCLVMISTQAQMKGLQLIKKIDSNLPSKLFLDSVK